MTRKTFLPGTDVNQVELVRRVGRRAGVPQRVVQAVLQAFYDEVAHTLSMGGRIRITNFGTFTTSLRACRNPLTGIVGDRRTFALWSARGRLKDIVSGDAPAGTLKKRISGGSAVDRH